jgi:serine/threonine protein kinase
MGWLPDGREVAIKRRGHNSWRGIEEFQAEVTILHSVSHKHIVRLFGSCVLQEKRQLLPRFWKRNENHQENMLVYEFLENGSLDVHLHGQPSPSPVTASWKMRIEILLGVSRAIEHLQSYTERPVIHRDVKPSNILLDASWAPRLTDFGLAVTWEGPDHKVCVSGTMGYLAPEYAMRGTVNLTSDVYSLGVVLLEVLTGKASRDLLEEGREKERDAYEEEKKREVRELEEEIREWEEEQQKRDGWKEKEETEDSESEDEERKVEKWMEKEDRDECEEEEDTTEEWDDEEDTTEERGEEPEDRAKQDFFARPPYTLVELAVPLIEASELWKVLDRRPAATPTPRQLEAAELVAEVAVRCVRLDWEARPSISEVVATLETALELARCDG